MTTAPATCRPVVPLFSSTALFLRSTRAGPLPPVMGKSLHALFLELIQETRPDLSKDLHDTDDLKAFSVYPLHIKSGIDTEGDRFVESGIGGRWRVGCLSEDVLAAFLESVGRREMNGQPVMLGELPFELRRHASTTKESVRWGRTSTPAQLLAETSRSREITVEFISPTSFRRQGRQFLFPEPELVFGSWLRRWASVGGTPPPEEMASRLIPEIFVARYELRTRLMPFGFYKIAGCEGRITFEVSREADEESVRWANALADFAFFAGTGYKTTMGMGETRRVEG